MDVYEKLNEQNIIENYIIIDPVIDTVVMIKIYKND